jgi:hypothetical protein
LLQGPRIGQVFHALDSADLPAVGLHRQRQTTAHHTTINLDCASTTDAVLAAQMGAFEAEFVAQQIDQVQSRRNGAAVGLSVDVESNGLQV